MHLIKSMAYVGDTPWHGLGSQLAPHQPLEVWAKAAGMDWDIEASEVRFVAGKDGLGSIHAFPEQKVLYRSDTKEPLSVVSDRYKVVQPMQILEFYRDLTEVGGFELETAGVLKGGKKLWALARTGQTVSLKGNDEVNGYLLLATACDGTMATTAQFTSVRVVCNNTLQIALGDSNGAIKVPHRSQFDPLAVKRQLGIAVSSWDAFTVRMRVLSERQIKQDAAQEYFRRVFAYAPSPLPASIDTGTNDRAIKATAELFAGSGNGSDLASAAGTAWGLVNSVTEYIDHHRRARSDDHRRDTAWFGNGAALKQRAWDEAMRFAV